MTVLLVIYRKRNEFGEEVLDCERRDVGYVQPWLADDVWDEVRSSAKAKHNKDFVALVDAEHAMWQKLGGGDGGGYGNDATMEEEDSPIITPTFKEMDKTCPATPTPAAATRPTSTATPGTPTPAPYVDTPPGSESWGFDEWKKWIDERRRKWGLG